MREFYVSDEFRQYRKDLLKTAIKYIGPMIMSPEMYQPGELKGALDMLRKIIEVPGESFAMNEKDKAVIGDMIKTDLIQVQLRTVTRHLIGEEG